MKKHIITSLLLLVIASCGSSDSPAPSGAASASISAGAASLDASGTWKVTASTCTGFPVVSSFSATVQTTTNGVQMFTGCSTTQPITCSDGTLDTHTGEMVLCYSDTLTSCAIKCTGVYGIGAPVALTCNDFAADDCSIQLLLQ